RGGRDALRADDVLDGDRDPFAAVVLADVQKRMQLRVALVDRGSVGPEDLGGRDLFPAHEGGDLPPGQAQRVEHHEPPGGTLKNAPSCSGALARASSSVSEGLGSSSPQTFTTSSGCDVGGTSERSSSETLETASMMSFSCAPSRSSSSSRS